MNTNDLVAGDVLFFRTNRASVEGGLQELLAANADTDDDFPALAALVQTYPYSVTGDGYRPWYHVAVFTGDSSGSEMVGFSIDTVDNDAALGASVRTSEFDLDVLHDGHPDASQPNVVVDVIRPPAEVASRLLQEALASIHRFVDGVVGVASTKKAS